MIQEINHITFEIVNRKLKMKKAFLIQPKNSYWKKVDFILRNNHYAQKFDIMLVDPPFLLAGNNPVRGPALNYVTMTLKEVNDIDFKSYVTSGYICVWIVSYVYSKMMQMLQKQGSIIFNEVHWIKISKKGRLRYTGYYFHHGSESCIIARTPDKKENDLKNFIIADRGLKSKKPI